MAAAGHSTTTAALIVAAGSGTRLGADMPKQYLPLGQATVLAHAVGCFVRHPAIGPVHLVVAPCAEQRATDALGPLADAVSIGPGGASRQQSVAAGLEQVVARAAAAGARWPDHILIHDAARPLVPAAMISRVLAALDESPAACPALALADSVRRAGGAFMEGEVDRAGLWRVQTPQGFGFADILAAHRAAAAAGRHETDDAAIARRQGLAVRLVDGDERAMKITTASDLDHVRALLGAETRVGSGFDVHAFGPGDHLMLCGVPVPHGAGLVGHSDADVALHALTDALLGALGAGDIGQHFPPSDPQWRGAASERFVRHAAALVGEAGGRIVHADLTIIAEAPRVGPHRAAMLDSLAAMLRPHAPALSLKATTTEGLGFTGRREGIAAQALATIIVPAERI